VSTLVVSPRTCEKRPIYLPFYIELTSPLSQSPGIQPKLEALRALYEGKKLIVGRDKLDVVKGVVQKLRAFEKLLHDYPQWIGQVVLIQVTSPTAISPDTAKLERQVSELVARINGEFGALDFIPVHH
jgi:trehalose 6-phosphate synthase/phosphatase